MTRILDFADGFESDSQPTGPATADITIKDEGSNVTNTPHGALNFVGAGVVASDAGAGEATITIPGAANINVQEEGSGITNTPHATLNFIGTAVTASDAGAGVADITINSEIIVEEEGSPVTNTPHQSINFIGSTITATDAGGGVVDVTVTAPAPVTEVIIQDEGSGIANTPHDTLNFVGPGVVASDGGAGVATITIPNENMLVTGGGTNIGSGPATTIMMIGSSDASEGIIAIRDGEVYALSIALNAARTAGDLDFEITLDGVVQNGAGEFITIDATNDQILSVILSSPIAYSTGEQIGFQTTSSGFSPGSSDATVAAWLRDT